MLSFITYKDVPEQIEIVADEKGIDELIDYLVYIKKSKDHMHLVIDSEIDSYPNLDSQSKALSAKHVRLEYSETESWKSIGN